jgi:hypothetical protein
MAGDWFLICPYCGGNYYGTAGHICPIKPIQYYNYGSSYNTGIYYYIAKEEYERLKKDSEDLAAIKRALGWNIGS